MGCDWGVADWCRCSGMIVSVVWVVGPRRPGHPPLLVSVYWASLVRAPLRFAKGCVCRTLWDCLLVLGIVSWFEGHYEVQSVALVAAGFWAHSESHAEFERVILAVMGIAE